MAEYARQMEQMFAAVGELYAESWSEFFHFAIFDDPLQSREDAFARTHQRYCAALRVDEARQIADLACGRGAFADLLAGQSSGHVTGIDISGAQLEHARAFRRPNLSFVKGDVMEVDRLAAGLDAVSCLDAACYFPDKRAAIRAISRIMSPRGRLLLVDWCSNGAVTALQDELVLAPFRRYWAVPNLATVEEYRGYLADAGFELLACEDLNAKTQDNWRLGYERAIEAVQRLSLKRAARLFLRGAPLRAGAMRRIKEQFAAALYIRAALDAGFMRYSYLLARKRG